MPNVKAEINIDGNHAEANSQGRRIKTVDQLIEYLEIDLSVWEIERAIVNKWEVGAKDTDGNIVVEPLFQVKVWLVKKSPEPLTPVVQAIQIDGFSKGLPSVRAKPRKRALMICDPHFGFRRDIHTNELSPFHDREAISLLMQVAQQFTPDVTVFAGDVLDLADWSDKFVKSPEMYWTTQPAIVEAAWVIANIARFSKRTVVIKGNHDARLQNLLTAHFMQAYDLRPANKLNEPPPMSIEELLGLKSMGVEYIGDYPDGRFLVSHDISIIHGSVARQAGGATASAVIDRENVSVGYGHIHRRELVTKTMWDGNKPYYVTGFSPGCVCRIDGFVPGSKVGENWQLGFAIIEFDGENESAINMVSINDGKCYYAGRYFEAKDYTKQIEKADYFKSRTETGKKKKGEK